MTATTTTGEAIETYEVEVLDIGDFDTAVQAFLHDPIGYGNFDYTDPISLDDFSCASHFHGRYVSALT